MFYDIYAEKVAELNSDFSISMGRTNIFKNLRCSTMDEAATVAKKLIGIKLPFKIDRRPDGHVVIFSDHFIYTYRKALSLNCIAEMSKREKDLYFGFIEWNKESVQKDVSESNDMELVFEALDEWTVDELLGNEHPDYMECGE